ncbi:NfeD family protein [Enterococcus sp. LJL128]|uniref:NfeD family protein n=1 Tax=Enterococcus sp. LJL51 TaxID=3416656 RepID=UPI003CE890C6
MIQGIPLQTIYLYVLIICAGLAVILLLIGDIFDFDGPVDPMLIIPWLAFTSLFGYLGEYLTDWSHILIFAGGAAVSMVLVFLMNFYLFAPMRNAESTISISEKDMEGQVAVVITPIPISGMGEIQLQSVTGSMSRPAALYSPQEAVIEKGAKVLIIEVTNRVCYVVPYENSIKI